VTRVASEIVIDGSLDEAAWRQAPTIGDLVQRIPVAGAAPTERTEVRLLYDEENLYIGVLCHDADPDRVLASQMARDARLNADDRLAIVLDTFRDQSNAFHFATNPAGAMVDGLVFANGETNDDWDAIWIVKTKRSSDGWSAEFAIPFKSLSFPSGQSVWGFNISRIIQRKLEEVRWTGARFQTQFFQVSEAGEITNLEGLLSTFPAIATCLLGIFCGERLQSGRSGRRLAGEMWMAGAAMVALGLAWDLVFPINKNLWTSSYVVFTAGTALLLLGTMFWAIDVKRWRGAWSAPFTACGMNSIAIFVASGMVAKTMVRIPAPDADTSSLYDWVFRNGFQSWAGDYNGSLALALAQVVFWLAVAWLMHRRRIYIKI